MPAELPSHTQRHTHTEGEREREYQQILLFTFVMEKRGQAYLGALWTGSAITAGERASLRSEEICPLSSSVAGGGGERQFI